MCSTRNNAGNVILRGIVALAILLGIVPATASAAVTAEPSVLVFHNMDQVETITLLADGQALPASALTGWRLLVDTRNYSHMLRVTRTDEGLRVTPSDTAEMGSYLLVLETGRGTATVQVFTPFTDYQSSIEKLAQRMDVTVEEVRRQMGLTQRIGREQISLNLLPIYYVGQRIQTDVPGVETRESVWKVNGEIVKRGVNTRRFTHVADTPGPLLITYEEYEDGRLIATDAALTEVTSEPAILHEVTVGANSHFTAPPGFEKHVWRVDGEVLAEGFNFQHTFDAPGRYSVVVVSSVPTEPGPYEFRETRYDVTAASN